METTLFQINKALENLASRHKFISSYYSEGYDEQASGNFKYPLMWANILSASPKMSSGEVVIPIDIYILDTPARNAKTFVPLLSDMLNTATEITTYFYNNNEDFGFFVENDVNFEPTRFDFGDKPLGYKMTINFQVQNKQELNIIPLD